MGLGAAWRQMDLVTAITAWAGDTGAWRPGIGLTKAIIVDRSNPTAALSRRPVHARGGLLCDVYVGKRGDIALSGSSRRRPG